LYAMATTNPELNGFLTLGANSLSKRAFLALLKAEVTERHEQHDQAVSNFAAQDAARVQAVATLNQRIDTVVGLAPESLDTLKELADAINNDPAFFSTIEAQMNENDLDITALNQAIGINENDAHLGGFNDSHLQDNQTLKQVLEAFAAAFTAYKTSNDAAVAAVQADVDQNEADCDAAISAEAAARAAADTAETTARQAAITALQADVDQNESDADASVAALQAADTAEATARASGDAALQTAIDAVQADVDQNETDADASIAALTAADATEATARAAADTTLQANIDAEATARAAADTTLQANIDAEVAARATAITNLVNGADAALDTLKEIGDALAAGDTSVTNALTAQITTEATTRAAALVQEATDRTAAIEAAKTLLNTAIAAVQSDVDTNEADADAAIATKLPLAGGVLTGSLAIQKSFPDLELKAGDEKRILFSDAGGGSTAAIKHVSSTLDLFAGGIAGGNKELSIAAGAVDVVNQLKIGGAAVTSSVTELNLLDGVTASTAELNHLDGVTANVQTQLDARAQLTGAQFTGNLEVLADFPDVTLKSGGERRILFSDAGGGAQGGIKFASNTMKFFAGGIAGGNQILSLDADSVDVDQTLVCSDGLTTNSLTLGSTAITATGDELNYVDGVTSAIQTQLDAKAPLAGPVFTGTPSAPTAAQSTNTGQIATTAYVQSNLTASLLRGFLGITENNGDPGDGRGVYYDTGASKYLTSS
jgi:hypothetical protein